MPKFIGRKQEMEALRREFDLKRASLLIVYGRRRVGKSRLLQEAVSGKHFIYFQASRETPALNIEALKRVVATAVGADPILSGLSDWASIFYYLADAAKRHPGLVVIIDEFSYLSDGDPALPSILQKFWDSGAPNSGRLKLVLCGSVISSMEALLAERNPLYGRQTGKFDIPPLPLQEAAAFFPAYSLEDQILAYAIFGGIPYYLEACRPDLSLKENVIDLLLSRSGRLFEEPANILQSELREVKIYASILHAIAGGCRESNEIRGRVFGTETGISLSPYLDRLMSMRIVKQTRSLDASPKARNTRYVISDHLIGFWHRFVGPNTESVSLGFGRDVWVHQIAPRLSDFMGPVFEDLCRNHARLHAQDFLSTPAQVIGQIWAGDYDIDVAGRLLDGTAVFGEAKWSTSPIGENVVETLLERSARTGYGRDSKTRQYLIYAKTGFTDALKTRAETITSLHLLGLAELVGRPPKTSGQKTSEKSTGRGRKTATKTHPAKKRALK